MGRGPHSPRPGDEDTARARADARQAGVRRSAHGALTRQRDQRGNAATAALTTGEHLSAPPGFTGEFRTDTPARAVYSEAAGIGQILPRAVAVARRPEDVLAIVNWARHHRIPITARGSGSSMANGAIGRGVILDLSRLDWIGDVDPDTRVLRCGAGAIRDRVDSAARTRGLRFPVNPSSGKFCTVGGMVATNAAAAHSLGFGATRAWVNSVECVLTDGRTVSVRRGAPPPSDLPTLTRAAEVLERCRQNAGAFHREVTKDSSGYAIGAWLKTGDIVDVLIGSEGTLAIITAVELRLAPLPAATVSLLAAFADLTAAAIGAMATREAGAVACELLDATFLGVAGLGSRLPEVTADTAAVLLVEIEAGDAAEARKHAISLERAFRAAGATATTVAMIPAAERELWELRHAASPILSKLDPTLSSVQVIEDGAVPLQRLESYVLAVRHALARRGIRGVIFGHAGDAHVHVNPLVNIRKPGWREQLTSLLEEITVVLHQLGGTLSGEHGDGRLRAPLLAQTWPAFAMRAFAELKQAFDPVGILNPGVKLPLADQQPIEHVKYDPTLPPLPPQIRAALDGVAERRGYATLRLSLLDSQS